MKLRLCANIDLNLINTGENMKALLIINGFNISDEEMDSFNRTNATGFERVSLNSFLFDLKISAHLLADLQSFLQGRGNHYHIFYLNNDVDYFSYPPER